MLFYLGTITVITAIFTACLLAEAHSKGLNGPWIWFVGVISLLAVSQLAIALVNWLTTRLVRAPSLAPNGLLQRNPSGIVCPGRSPHYAHQH